jgi:hypothetical protein|tara:strand:- start:651 stop:1712 length:1062 start_codon:yes stop_codon:yes gene_type:complete
MTARRSALGSLVLGIALVPTLAGAQTRAADWDVPRTADGQPDLQGVWDFRTMTPLQRPRDQEKAVLTEEEAAELEQRAAERVARADAPSEVRAEPLPAGQPVGGYNNFWLDRGGRVVEDRRTALIVDLPTGRVPELQSGAIRQVGSLGEDLPSQRPVRYRSGGIYPDGPEDRGVSERCIVGFNSGPPLLPGGYNQNIQLFQTPDHVVVLSEMVHEVRIVPLDGRPHVPDSVRQWLGDGRGYWDGDTLVIESQNFSDQVASFNAGFTTALGTGTTLHLTGRFTRVDEDTLRYEFTVDDPDTFTQPISGVLQLQQGTQPLFEYACHEGNYGMRNSLSGARAAELDELAENAGNPQ